MKKLTWVLLALLAFPAMAQNVVPGPAINPACNAQTGAYCTVWTPAQWVTAWQSVVSAYGGYLTNGQLFGTTVNNGTISGGTVSANVSGSTVLATGSTTARTLAARAADRINVLDRGFDPTGIADNGPALAILVASLPTTPVTLWFPAVGAANYKFNSNTQLPDTTTVIFDSGVTFSGSVGISVITDLSPLLAGASGQTIGRMAQRGGNAYAQYLSFPIYNNSSTASSEKAALYINTIQGETSNFTSYTKDAVGINSTIQPSYGNTTASITASLFAALVPSGTDGIISAAEFNLNNNSGNAWGAYGTPKTKNNVNITNGGSTTNTGGVVIEAGPYYDGFVVQSGAVSRNAYSITNFNTNATLFSVDGSGNISGQNG